MSRNIGESRSELLAWLNELLHLNYKKIEECGTGAAYCQILDSIYGDIPMQRVKFNTTSEYEYHTNYKILQSCFRKHGIEKPVNVERLVKCRFQDNLEFLQWLKKYWAQTKDSSPYDAEARRKHRAVSSGPTMVGGASATVRRKSSMPASTSINSNGMHRPSPTFGSGSIPGRRTVSDQYITLQTELAQAQDKVRTLESESSRYRETVNLLERERDFYFGKLRDIEILVLSTQDLIKEGVFEHAEGMGELDKFLNKVTQILYAAADSQEGPEVPADNGIINNNHAEGYINDTPADTNALVTNINETNMNTAVHQGAHVISGGVATGSGAGAAAEVGNIISNNPVENPFGGDGNYTGTFDSHTVYPIRPTQNLITDEETF